MGGRGSSGGKMSGGNEPQGRRMSLNNFLKNYGFGGQEKELSLSEDLVRRANNASFAVDAGSATAREYEKNIKSISEMNLSASEKSAGAKTLHKLTEEQLRAEAKAVNPYTSGPARFNKGQVSKNADIAVQKRQNVKNHMESLNKKSKENARAKSDRDLTSAIITATASGKMEFTFNGKTYYKKRKNSTSWYVK